MLPSDDQIRRVAYGLWLGRGGAHGFDRDDWFTAENELTFSLNYRTIVEYALDVPGMLVASGRPVRYCRFCEQSPSHATFSATRPVVADTKPSPLRSDSVCDLCQSDCLDSLSRDAGRFWDFIRANHANPGAARAERASTLLTLPVLKSLVAGALLIMPESELSYFVDTLEWIGNPDHGLDAAVFAGLTRRVSVSWLTQARWAIGLARRIDLRLSLPYMICFLVREQVVVQFPVPLCVRDQDLDGRQARTVVRPLAFFTAGQEQQSRLQPV